MKEHFKWRIVSDSGVWKQAKGRELKFEMTEADAESWQAANPSTVIEKVEGSGNIRQGHGLTSDLLK